MTNISNIYFGNFTPNTTSNYSFRIFSKDIFNNFNATQIINLSVALDYSWVRLPIDLDEIYTTQGTTVPLGNITINNTGDGD